MMPSLFYFRNGFYRIEYVILDIIQKYIRIP